MPCKNPGCIRKYDFERIAFYARKRYVEGISTIVLLGGAKTEDERKIIVLACMLDLADDRIRELNLYCGNDCLRTTFNLRNRLKSIVEQELSMRKAG